jgi:2-polyprenyl-6-methoxyphenol hydroxylase-like FAD-dependent oxidoreductase
LSKRAVIVGCGVAGPSLALFLQRIGWEPVIYEAAAEPDEYAGLFLNVATNGLAVLDELGLRERVLADAHPCPHMVMWSGRGKRLGQVPNGPAGAPERGSAVIRRAELHQALREEAQRQGVAIHPGARLEAIKDNGRSVEARFADGRTAMGDVLFGCDGINSITRAFIDPQGPRPTYTGMIGLGGYARLAGIAPTPQTQHFVFGRRSFFGYLVRSDGEVYWFANVTRTEPAAGTTRRTTSDEWLRLLRGLHAHDPEPVPQILAAATGELRAYPIYDLAHVPRWHRGRIVAVGDAVHGTSPSVGQGASLALEDAIVLAKCLRDRPAVDEAFAAYQRLRQPRAEQLVAYAQEINKHKRVSTNPLAVRMRDAIVPFFLRKAASDTTNAWIYNYQVDWHAPISIADGTFAASTRARDPG